jgi:bacterioferritin
VKAKPGVVDLLNTILTNELTAINQYFVQAEMCRNWGLERLGKRLRELSIEEMKDTEALIAHILYLEGMPNMQRLNKVMVGENAQEHLELDLQLEQQMVDTLTDAIRHCADVGDFTTRHMLESMVHDEEEHVDWLETQLELIRQVGLQTYLGEQIHD